MSELTIPLKTLREVAQQHPIKDYFLFYGVWYRVASIQADYPELADPQTKVSLAACSVQEVAVLHATYGEACRAIERAHPFPVKVVYTPEQMRLYQRLCQHCQQHHMWVGTAAKLALFADLSYPIDPAITVGLKERGLIKIGGSGNCWMITVCEIEQH